MMSDIFWRHGWRSLRVSRLLWEGMLLGGAVAGVSALTWACAESGLDASVNAWARQTPRLLSLFWSAPPMLLGLVAPGVVPMILFMRRGVADVAARQVALSVVLALAVNLVLKALTGRTSPEAELPLELLLRSQDFAFGWLEGGVWEGWPSGHAMTNGALGGALYRFEREPWVRRLGVLWAGWVLLAVVLGIQGEVHWLSDGLAGVMLGVGTVCRVGAERQEQAE